MQGAGAGHGSVWNAIQRRVLCFHQETGVHTVKQHRGRYFSLSHCSYVQSQFENMQQYFASLKSGLLRSANWLSAHRANCCQAELCANNHDHPTRMQKPAGLRVVVWRGPAAGCRILPLESTCRTRTSWASQTTGPSATRTAMYGLRCSRVYLLRNLKIKHGKRSSVQWSYME